MECICHISSGTKPETLLRLATDDRVKKLLYFAEKWIHSDKQPELQIAGEIFKSRESITVDTLYHQSCYLRFATESKFERASTSKRRRKVTRLIKKY